MCHIRSTAEPGDGLPYQPTEWHVQYQPTEQHVPYQPTEVHTAGTNMCWSHLPFSCSNHAREGWTTHPGVRGRANMTHVKETRPDFDFGFHVKVHKHSIAGRYHVTQCIHQLVLESQLPHKTVNLIS